MEKWWGRPVYVLNACCGRTEERKFLRTKWKHKKNGSLLFRVCLMALMLKSACCSMNWTYAWHVSFKKVQKISFLKWSTIQSFIESGMVPFELNSTYFPCVLLAFRDEYHFWPFNGLPSIEQQTHEIHGARSDYGYVYSIRIKRRTKLVLPQRQLQMRTNSSDQ